MLNLENIERSIYIDQNKKIKSRDKLYTKELLKIGDDQLCDVIVDNELYPRLKKSDFCVFNRAIIDDVFINNVVRVE